MVNTVHELGFARTAGQAAARLIRDRILSGEYGPGALLHQSELAAQFGMSRIPIRDALGALAAEGLVELRAHATASVTPLTVDDLQELYEIRTAHEPKLTAMALPRLTSEDMSEMASLLGVMESAGDETEWLAANNRFHRIMYCRAPRPRGVAIVDRSRMQTDRYTRVYTAIDRVDADAEHRLILSAVRNGQVARLEALVRAHLSAGYETMLQVLGEDQDFPYGEKSDAPASKRWMERRDG